jgi:cytochrome c-type biogenesis protein CcmH
MMLLNITLKNTVLFISILVGVLILVTPSQYANASPVETFVFENEVDKIRFQALSKELRCPKCQNQNLADSNSTVAVALRLELYNMIKQGRADSEIVSFMVGRYGEFVLYNPRVTELTYVLWFGPAFLILMGVLVVFIIVRRKPEKKEKLALSSQQQDKLNKLLNDEHN